MTASQGRKEFFSTYDSTEVSHLSSFNLVPQNVPFQNVSWPRMGCKCNHSLRIKKKKSKCSVVFIIQTEKTSHQWIKIVCHRSHSKSVAEQETELRVSCALDKNSCLQNRLSLCSSNELLHCFLMYHVPSSTCPSRMLEAPGHCVTMQCQNVTIISAGWWQQGCKPRATET